ncbi:putative TIR domain, P-loop containing nucleoside triphosphate hydrolase [Helianthus debilis subsp. tardiflorus]
MASSSSSGVMVSSGDKAFSYDVFLSFRGEDTRHSFTDHLYHKLIQAGICTFRDDKEINRGEELKPEIEKAIKASRSSIVVLSENYATSTWCLDELLLILQQRRECNHFVLPVFYYVKPTDVRKNRQKFYIKVKKTSSRWTHHNVEQWRTALRQVGDLTGFELSGSQASFLNKIVDTIYNKLDRKEVHLPFHLIGMLNHHMEINSWLHQPNNEYLVIYGMGGSGKTTLAKYVYNMIRRFFESVSFVEDIGNRCKGPNDILQFQKQLLKDILGGKNRKIPGVSRGTCLIEEALQMKRTLIVLDDIVEHSQLVALLGTGRINAQSKIIITTRVNTNNWPLVRCKMYPMRLLNDDESLQLIMLHAFGSKIPNLPHDVMSLILEGVNYCEGNPLALEVLGSSMVNNICIRNWKSYLSLLERDMDSRLQCVLLRSYMSLPYNSDKELFLHIACFFIGKDMDYVVKILEPDYSAITGIKTLINRCLLSVSPNKKLTMHRLLQEMGKNIIRQESTKFPAKRSRVWLSSDSYKILSEGEGSKLVEGFALDMKMLPKEDFAFMTSKLKTDALKNMDSLKLLKLSFVEINGSYENFSEGLRWLCWIGFHLTTIPADLYMGNLVAIDMSYSKLEVFEPPMVVNSVYSFCCFLIFNDLFESILR